jgi:NTE family protein
LKRNHDLRRMIALMGEHLPASARRLRDVKRCLEAASAATMTILHLVHEESAGDLEAKMADFSAGTLSRRWQAGESDVATSFAQPLWLKPPPPLSGAVVHELRRGILAPPR